MATWQELLQMAATGKNPAPPTAPAGVPVAQAPDMTGMLKQYAPQITKAAAPLLGPNTTEYLQATQNFNKNMANPQYVDGLRKEIAEDKRKAAEAEKNITDNPEAPRPRDVGGGGGGVIPAHWDETRWPLQASTMQEIAGLEAKEVKLRSSQMDVQQAQLDAVKATKQQEALLTDQHNKRLEQQRVEEDIQKQQQLSELRQRQKEVESFQLDPGRIFSKSALFDAGFLVKGVLDGFISGYTGRTNEFDKFTDRLLKMDESKQLAVYDKLKRAEAGQRNLMADYEKLTGSRHVAQMQRQVERLSALEVMFKQKMAEIDAGTPAQPGAPSTWGGVTTGTPGLHSKAQMNFDAAMQELDARKVNLQKQIDVATHVNTQALGGGGGGTKNSDLLVPVEMFNPETGKMERFDIKAKSGAEAAELRSKVAGVANMDRYAKESEEKSGFFTKLNPFGTGDKARLEGLSEEAAIAAGQAKGLKQMTKDEQEAMRRFVGNQTDIFNSPQERLKSAARSLRKDLEEQIKSQHPEIFVRESQGPGKEGKHKPTGNALRGKR